MRASRTQFLQTRFEAHVDLGCIFFEKARSRPVPYAWMARMQFDKAARHSPQRADEIAKLYAAHGRTDVAVSYYEKRVQDASCNHDPHAWTQLGSALEARAGQLKPQTRLHAQVQTRAQAAFAKAAVLNQPAQRPGSVPDGAQAPRQPLKGFRALRPPRIPPDICAMPAV